MRFILHRNIADIDIEGERERERRWWMRPGLQNTEARSRVINKSNSKVMRSGFRVFWTEPANRLRLKWKPKPVEIIRSGSGSVYPVLIRFIRFADGSR